MSDVKLSVIVTIVGGGTFLDRCLLHLVSQDVGPPIEILVPFDSSVGEIDPFKSRFPTVDFLDMGEVETAAEQGSQASDHELYDRRSAHGIRHAQGEIIALLQDYTVPNKDWCEQVLKAHELPHGVVGGVVEHGGVGALSWAIFFQDFGRHQPPLPEGPATYLTDINVSYKRSVLEPIKALWQDRYKEVTVNWALAKQGVTLWQRPQIVVRQDRGRLSLRSVIPERYHWGRLFGAIRTESISTRRRWLYTLLSPAVPLILLGRLTAKVIRDRHPLWHFVNCLPCYCVLSWAWCFGEFVGNLTGRDSRR